jgi:predicted PurR-regulated permease PerM
MKNEQLGRSFLLLLVVAISILFVAMIRNFLMTLLLAAIFSGLAHPLYNRLQRAFRGRRSLASAATLVVLLLVIIVPLLAVLGIVAGQALRVSEDVTPWVQEHIAEPGALAKTLEGLPGYDRIAPYREQILTKAGQLVGGLGAFLFDKLSGLTRGTVAFFFQLFLMLYAMFFFLTDGGAILSKILYYLPLGHEAEQRMLEKFTSVTRATIKGTLVIGVAQGVLAGLAFWVAGIGGAVFWGTLMIFLSIIPGIGTGLVWAPAAVILILAGHVWRGVGLVLFCALVVGSIDNFLRPRLVGRDTQMHDLLILFGTLGGIVLFGVIGFIIGPVVSALFVTVWDIYGTVFKDALPAVGRLGKPRKEE